jgi:hypothetical protein
MPSFRAVSHPSGPSPFASLQGATGAIGCVHGFDSQARNRVLLGSVLSVSGVRLGSAGLEPQRLSGVSVQGLAHSGECSTLSLGPTPALSGVGEVQRWPS